MCCTFERAEMFNTILYGGEALKDGKLVHVLGYQNNVDNHSDGPNAMILPFPAKPMGPANIVSCEKTPSILKDMVRALRSTYDSVNDGVAVAGACAGVQVFESGRYTVVLADDARKIRTAINLVPADRRPALNHEIMVAYAHWYPGWPIALCCFNGREMRPADPLLWWYEPKDETQIFLPALDAHDGNRPNLTAKVTLDHTILVGSSLRDHTAKGWRSGPTVEYSESLPADVAAIVPDRIFGVEMRYREVKFNMDFVVDTAKLRNGSYYTNTFDRKPPPGFKALF